jgi:hypothetical protein
MVNGIEDPLHSGFVVARDDAPFLAGVGPSFLKPEAVSSGVHPSLAKEWPAAAAFGLAAACVVSPILGTSFLGDDAFNSYVDGWIAAHHSTLAGAFAAYFREWDIGRGRFIPLLQILNILQFHAFHQPYPLKLLQTIAIGFDVATLYAVVRTFGASAARSALACVVSVLSLQIRYAYDPISQYNLHLPLSTEAALLTLFFAARYARDARGRDLAAAVSCFAVATLFYEIFAPLALSIPFVLRRSGSPWRPLLVASAPFSAIVLLEGLIVGVVRHVSPQPAGTAYAPTLMGAYVATLARQLAGTLPFSYPVFDPQAVFRAAQPFWFLRPSLGACVAAASVAIGIAAVRPGGSSSGVLGLAAAGVALFVGPAALVSASPFYQQTIVLGAPYIPVFAQSFGLALIVASLPLPVFSAVPARAWKLFFATICAAGACVLTTANTFSVSHFDAWKFPRETIVTGLTHGAARELRDGSTLLLDDSYIVNERMEPGSVWHSQYFYDQWTGHEITTSPRGTDASLLPSNRAVFALRSRHNTADGGALIVARLATDRRGPYRVVDALIVERHGSSGIVAARPTSVLGGLAGHDFGLVNSGPGFATYSFRPTCARLSTDVLETDEPTSGNLVFGDGFSVEESDASRRWHWGGLRATLSVRNPTALPLDTSLLGVVGTVGTASGSIAISIFGKTHALALSAGGRPIAVALSIPPHSRVTLDFRATAPNVAVVDDGRDLRFRVIDGRLRDRGGCALSDER